MCADSSALAMGVMGDTVQLVAIRLLRQLNRNDTPSCAASSTLPFHTQLNIPGIHLLHPLTSLSDGFLFSFLFDLALLFKICFLVWTGIFQTSHPFCSKLLSPNLSTNFQIFIPLCMIVFFIYCNEQIVNRLRLIYFEPHQPGNTTIKLRHLRFFFLQ